VIGGSGNGAINSLAGVLISRRTPAAVRGRAFARFGAVASAANMTGFLLGGFLVGPFTPRFLLVACGVLGVAVAIVCLLPLLRATHRERARAVASVTPQPAAPAAA
jgi:MFS family permease